ncbi:hypothetical protein CTZ27_03155 [Streptomyces griseocarneus]|nr:hypothetical protein CTZ27_03155 [Streptomyces griseocarneus]
MFLAEVDETAQWSVTDHLIARVSDAVEVSNYLFIKANSDSADDLPLPEPVPRPGHPEPQPPQHDFASGAELSAFLTQMNDL